MKDQEGKQLVLTREARFWCMGVNGKLVLCAHIFMAYAGSPLTVGELVMRPVSKEDKLAVPVRDHRAELYLLFEEMGSRNQHELKELFPENTLVREAQIGLL